MCYFLKGMPQSLPDLENIWNSEDAAASEKVMQDLLPSANSLLGAERSYTVALLAQIARAQGAQGQFPMARATLRVRPLILCAFAVFWRPVDFLSWREFRLRLEAR
jgi:hypothetical protein